jgi:hypothetical protein
MTGSGTWREKLQVDVAMKELFTQVGMIERGREAELEDVGWVMYYLGKR